MKYCKVPGGASFGYSCTRGHFTGSHTYMLKKAMYKFLCVAMAMGSAPICAGLVVLTQTYPAAPYMCRTGNITLRCQYDKANIITWSVANMPNVDLSTIPGHTALNRTTTYQEVVVNNYTNLREWYRCTIFVLRNFDNSETLHTQLEGKVHMLLTLLCSAF